MHEILHSRLEPGRPVSPALKSLLRQAFGPFCMNLMRVRLSVLAPSEHQVAYWLAVWSLKAGRPNVNFRSLAQLSGEECGGRPFMGLGANDLSPAIHGLARLGIVLVDESLVLEPGWRRTIWSPVTDVALWHGVPANGWYGAAADVAAQGAHVAALGQWPTASLAGLEVEADLKDGLISPTTHAVGAMPSGRGGADARSLLPGSPLARLAAVGAALAADARQRDAGQAIGLPARPGDQRDAGLNDGDARPAGIARPGRALGGSGVADRGRRSEGRNGESPAMAGRILAAGMHLKRDQERPERSLKINLKGWAAYSIGDKKEALYELEDCNDDDRVRRLLEVILGEDVAAIDAGKWIIARRTMRQQVTAAMTLVVEHMTTGEVRAAGALAHFYGQRLKIFKESF